MAPRGRHPYLSAGADLILTDTFGATPLKLDGYGLADKAQTINCTAVGILRDRAGARAYVIGSVGPTGRILEPYGDTSHGEVSKSFLAQMEALIDAGVDGICVETMVDIEEAKLAIAAARKFSSRVPIFATMTFEETPRGVFTIMGVSVSQAATELADAGADVVGANCGVGMRAMKKIAWEFREKCSLPLIFQANAGCPERKKGQWIYPETPEKFSDEAVSLIEVGVSVIGGCCGTTPAHIFQLRQRVNRFLKDRNHG